VVATTLDLQLSGLPTRIQGVDVLRRIRHRLFLISYYSKSRDRSGWSLAIDVALFVSFFLALPAALAAEALYERPITRQSVEGRISGVAGGPFEARVMTGERDERWTEVHPWGEWELIVRSTDRGWPFSSVRRLKAPALDLNRFQDPGTARDVLLMADDPERVAIERALEADERPDLVETWRRGRSTEAERHWLGLLANTMVWWVVLSFASVSGIRTLSFLALVRRAKRVDRGADRASTGRCRNCDYDLTGLEFHERCPECGGLIH
jgi:hypothetical protein